MLHPDLRLRENKDFRRVYAHAKSHVHPLAVIYDLCRTNDLKGKPVSKMNTRIGFVVSKKQGGAAIRNRIKRRLREAVRRQIHSIAYRAPHDIVFVARKRIYSADWPQILGAVEELIRRSGLLISEPRDAQQ